MAGSRKSIQKLLDRHKLQISRELDRSQSGMLSQLTKKGVINMDEERQINSEQNIAARGDLFVEILAKKGFNAFREMCNALELECPHLLTSLLLDSTGKRKRNWLKFSLQITSLFTFQMPMARQLRFDLSLKRPDENANLQNQIAQNGHFWPP